ALPDAYGRGFDHVAVAGHDVVRVQHLDHPATAALAGRSVHVAGPPPTVVLIALDHGHDTAGGGVDDRIAPDDEVDALVRRPGRSPEPGADRRPEHRQGPAGRGDLA